LIDESTLGWAEVGSINHAVLVAVRTAVRGQTAGFIRANVQRIRHEIAVGV